MKWLIPFTILLLAGCGSREHPKITAIVGATLLNPDTTPVERSVVIIQGAQIRAAGPQALIPIPNDAEIIDGTDGQVKPFAMELIAPGRRADLTFAKGVDIRIMTNGEWVVPRK